MEYQQFLDVLAERLKNKDKVNLVVDLTSFEFYDDFETFKQDFKFAFGEYKQIRRAALVGNQKWIEWFTRLIDPFTRTEEKVFPAEKLDEAINWAESNLTSS